MSYFGQWRALARVSVDTPESGGKHCAMLDDGFTRKFGIAGTNP